MFDYDWMLLVQDVDKWDLDVCVLVGYFDFLLCWCMDDVMISFVVIGGLVGVYVDQYDVFLLQGYGYCCWQIDVSELIKGKCLLLDFCDDVELKLLCWFKLIYDWVLVLGDMLYLLLNVLYNGVVEDFCLIFFFGMCVLVLAELISDYFDILIMDVDEFIWYQDLDLKVFEDLNEIDVVVMNCVVVVFNVICMNDLDKFGDWFGCFIIIYCVVGEVMVYGELVLFEEVVVVFGVGLVLQCYFWLCMVWWCVKCGVSLYCSGLEFVLLVKDVQLLVVIELFGVLLYQKFLVKGCDVVYVLLVGGYYQLFDLNVFDDEDEDVYDDEDQGDVIVGYVIFDVSDIVEVVEVEDVCVDVYEVIIYDDGIEVIVDFDDSDGEDDVSFVDGILCC